MSEPSTRVRRAVKQLAAAEVTLARARAELHAAIVADLGAGVRQAELVRATGYSRERIRQITRGAESAGAA